MRRQENAWRRHYERDRLCETKPTGLTDCSVGQAPPYTAEPPAVRNKANGKGAILESQGSSKTRAERHLSAFKLQTLRFKLILCETKPNLGHVGWMGIHGSPTGSASGGSEACEAKLISWEGSTQLPLQKRLTQSSVSCETKPTGLMDCSVGQAPAYTASNWYCAKRSQFVPATG